MALTQVRVKLGEQWTVLSYNAATGRYEGTLTPQGTSIHQPGGYYTLTAEARNASGQTAVLTGEQYKGLRLVVRETAAPTVSLVSPPQGWLTTASPVVVFSAHDEAGGSGIETGSVQAAVDGSSVPFTVQQSGGAYQITLRPTGLSEGPHVVAVSVSDRDGNRTAASAAYQVDTVPPVISIVSPNLHRVVDWESVEVSGWARDATSGVARVMINGEPLSVGTENGRFAAVVPLEVGVNEIAVTATDVAGLSSSVSLWMLRLVTDRTQEDVDAIRALLGKPWEGFTAAERALWQGVIRGAYNTIDLNRVGAAVEYIAGYLLQAGYAPGVEPRTDWTDEDAPTVSELDTYLTNVARLQALLPVQEPQAPTDMDGFTYSEANDLETILVQADRLFPLMEQSVIYSGEAFAGEF